MCAISQILASAGRGPHPALGRYSAWMDARDRAAAWDREHRPECAADVPLQIKEDLAEGHFEPDRPLGQRGLVGADVAAAAARILVDFESSPHGGHWRPLPDSGREPAIAMRTVIHHSIVGSAEGAFQYFAGPDGDREHLHRQEVRLLLAVHVPWRAGRRQLPGQRLRRQHRDRGQRPPRHRPLDRRPDRHPGLAVAGDAPPAPPHRPPQVPHLGRRRPRLPHPVPRPVDQRSRKDLPRGDP